MKILIAGLPKSGTTILTYRIAEALDGAVIDFEPIDGPSPTDDAGAHVVSKKLVGTQTTDFDAYEHYDRKIWIARDPRDFLVSQSLYRWHREQAPEPIDQVWFDRVIEKLRAKERDPGSVAFQELEPANYFETLDAVAVLKDTTVGPDWFVFRYEDMVDGHYEALNRYLGFDVVVDAEVADGFTRVARRKGYGDWRDWFVPSDVSFYAAGGLQRYMEAFDYDLDDWDLNDPQTIDPAHCSQYVTALFTDYLPTDGNADGATKPAGAGSPSSNRSVGGALRSVVRRVRLRRSASIEAAS